MPTDASASATDGEQAEQQRAEALRRQRLVEHVLHRADVLDRLLRIDRADRRPRPAGASEAGGTDVRSTSDRLLQASLARVLVDGRRRGLGQLALLHVADDADHFLAARVLDCSGSVTRRPIGSSSPHSSFAAARLTSSTSTSLSATSRPRSSGMPIARR